MMTRGAVLVRAVAVLAVLAVLGGGARAVALPFNNEGCTVVGATTRDLCMERLNTCAWCNVTVDVKGDDDQHYGLCVEYSACRRSSLACVGHVTYNGYYSCAWERFLYALFVMGVVTLLCCVGCGSTVCCWGVCYTAWIRWKLWRARRALGDVPLRDIAPADDAALLKRRRT